MPTLNFDVVVGPGRCLHCLKAKCHYSRALRASRVDPPTCSTPTLPLPPTVPTPKSLLMQSESVFAFMHVACVHIYLREHLCVCVTVRMRDAHKMPSENKSLYSTLAPHSLSRFHLHAGKQFIYVPSCPGTPLLMPAACCLISVCPSFSYPFLHWGASSSTSSSSLSLCAIAIAIVERAGGVVTLS